MDSVDGPTMANVVLKTRSSRRTVVGSAATAALLGHQVAGAGSRDGGYRGPGRALRAWQPSPAGHVQAVISAHNKATDAGLEILAAGGSAADAAIAVASALTVVDGWFSSVLGGGTWALYYDAASGRVSSLDGVGPVGSRATREDYASRAGDDGIHQSNVPGAWDGWMLWLDRYGRLDLGEVLEPAIRLARDGFVASSELAYYAGNNQEQIFSNPASTRVYAPEGVLPANGDVLVMTDLADTFEALVAAYDGALDQSRTAAVQAARDYYYRGPLAQAVVSYSDENSGYLTLDDFAGFAAEIVDPVWIRYRDDIVVYQNPPNSQGVTMLLALNTLKRMGLSDYDINDPDAVHMQVEAMKLAFADRYAHIGDPDRIEIPMAELLSEDYAERQRQRIDLDQALEWPLDSRLAGQHPPAHTTTFQVVDGDGNAASVTTSLGLQFLLIPGTGIHMNNRMRMLSVEPSNANELTPGYKVRHTSCPYLALRGGRPYILGGNTGADSQTQGQLQQFLSVVEFGLDAQAAIDRPRWITRAFPSTSFPWEAQNTLHVQEGFPSALAGELQAKGHDIVNGESPFGQAGILILADDGSDADAGVEPNVSTATGEVIPAAT